MKRTSSYDLKTLQTYHYTQLYLLYKYIRIRLFSIPEIHKWIQNLSF